MGGKKKNQSSETDVSYWHFYKKMFNKENKTFNLFVLPEFQ